MKETTAFVEGLYQKYIDNGIRYCILRNVEEVEQGDAHDVDMTVDVKRMLEAEMLILQHAEKTGWKLHIKTGSAKDTLNIKCYHFYKVVNNEIHILHFDFFPTFMWKGYILLDNAQLLANMDESTLYHCASPAVEGVTKLFIRLLHNGYVKDKYKAKIQFVFQEDADTVQKLLQSFLDQQLVIFVMNSVLSSDWMALEQKRASLIKSIKVNTKHRFFTNKLYLVQKTMKKIGVMVVFEGTDGSGKSTVINGLTETLVNSFPEGMFDYYHWRPGVILKKKSADATVTEPHAKPPYGKWKSLAKFLLFNLDYVAGYWLKVRWQLSKGHLVVFDRYYYDYYMDKLRYRLSIGNGVLRAFQWMIPKPDVTFVLTGTPEILYERKREISVEEIAKQSRILMEKQQFFHHSVMVNVDEPVNAVIARVGKVILETCGERNNRR